MNTSYLRHQAALAGCLHSACAPKGWQRSFAAQGRRAMSVMCRLTWIKQIRLESSLSRGPLLGRCLQEEMFNNGTRREPPADKAPQRVPVQTLPENKSRRAVHGHSPVNTAAANKGGKPLKQSSCRMPTGSSTAEKSQSTERCKNLQQVLNLTKTVNQSELKNWSANIRTDASADTCTSKGGAAGRGESRSTTQANKQTARARCSFAGQSPSNQLHTNQHHTRVLAPHQKTTSRWRQQVEDQVKKNLRHFTRYCEDTETTSQYKSSRAPQYNESLWKTPLVNAANNLAKNMSHRLTDGELMQLLETPTLRCQPLQFGADRTPSGKQAESPAQRKADTPFDQLIPTVRENKERTRTDSEMLNREPQAGEVDRSQRLSQQEQSTNHSADSQPQREQTLRESPEFPPLPKIINDELRPSGKRTPLKSENSAVQAINGLDEEELADALKRILDDQARRHGIKL